MNSEIIISIVTSITTIIVTLLNLFLKKRNKELQSEKEDLIKNKDKLIGELSAINILFNHQFIATLDEILYEIFEQTKVTRFLMLFAVNGKQDFKYVTACYEENRTSPIKKAIRKYVRIEIDNYYKQILYFIEKNKYINLVVKDMPKSVLKNIYQSYDEKIEHSIIHFIRRINIDDKNDLLLYCYTATNFDKPFSSSEEFIIHQGISRLRNEANNLEIELEMLKY